MKDIGAFVEAAKQAEDALLTLFQTIGKRRQENFTELSLEEVCGLQNLDFSFKPLAQYIVHGILTEADVKYDAQTKMFRDLDYGKLRGSLATMISLNKKAYENPSMQAALEEERGVKASLENWRRQRAAIRYLYNQGHVKEALSRQEEYETMMKENATVVAAKGKEQLAIHEAYENEFRAMRVRAFCKEELRYQGASLFGNYVRVEGRDALITALLLNSVKRKG